MKTKNLSQKVAVYVGLCVGLVLCAFTQFYKQLAVPGLHFDEAWQGLWANRIAFEPGFFPFSAMNSYTASVFHYVLAVPFKFFGTSLAVMRGAIGVINLVSCLLFVGLFFRFQKKIAAVWFVLLWALLPLSVHNHRFYIEMTSLFGLLYAMLCWGVALWKQKRALAKALIVSSVVLGVYAHVLFFGFFLGTLLACVWFSAEDFKSKSTKNFLALLLLLCVPQFTIMAVGTKKILPAVLVFLLCSGAFICAYAENFWHGILGKVRFSVYLVTLASKPFLVFYVFFLLNGCWSYAQVTGTLFSPYFSANLVLLLVVFFLFMKKERFLLRIKKKNSFEEFLFFVFLSAYVFGSILAYKQNARYAMVPTIAGMAWLSVALGTYLQRWAQVLLLAFFVAWNAYAFQAHYIQPFETRGAADNEFKVLFFHDNARDFRPFQKAYDWAYQQGCGDALTWVEDDRFLLPVNFLKMSQKSRITAKCPWKKGELFFSHLPQKSTDFELVHTQKEWGDLAFFRRPTVNKENTK